MGGGGGALPGVTGATASDLSATLHNGRASDREQEAGGQRFCSV